MYLYFCISIIRLAHHHIITLYYSLLKFSTGLLMAALTACTLTVIKAIATAAKPATTNTDTYSVGKIH